MELAIRYNYYDILEVNPHCPQHEITAAYERAKATYSGENVSIYTIFTKEEARELLGLVEEAYMVLGNKALRAVYDERITQGGYAREDLTFVSLEKANKAQLPETKKRFTLKPAKEPDAEFESQVKSLERWDGAWLRKVREYRELSLDKVSEITKINPFYINAIEEMQLEHLPARVFVRGYVGQIAKLLGLNESHVAKTYMDSCALRSSKVAANQ